MGTALFTGVTGLQVHQRRIDVIANNIANVNTTGFRGSRMLFQDLFSQTLFGPRAPVNTFGGTNPGQIGLGVRIGAIDVNHTQGALTTTGVASDLAIQGSGFFILANGTDRFYTRDGTFNINNAGALVDPGTGLVVQGVLADDTGVIDPNGPITDIVIPVGATAIVRATTEATLIGNVNSDAATGDTVVRTVRVFDSLGTARDITITFTKSATTNQWDWAATTTDPDVATITGAGSITFDASGNVTAGGVGNVSMTFVAGLPATPVQPFAFDLDFSSVTQLAAESDVVVSTQDGFPRGVLESFNIGADGIINGIFTNGLTRELGQVALATFSNNGGLIRYGNNLFRDSPGSGLPQVGIPNTGGRGTVTGGVLENSNVDLGTEFSNLIITQRGFQANARTITTADTLLQETVNLIR